MGDSVQEMDTREVSPTQGQGEPDQPITDWLSDEYLYAQPKRSDIRMGTVFSVKPDEILVDIGSKRTGIVLQRDLERLDEETLELIKPGNELYVYVLSPQHEGHVLLSISMALSMRDWQRAEKVMGEGTIFEAEVTGFNRGGLLVDYGLIQGFVPSSQVVALRRRPRGEDNESVFQNFVGQVLPFKIIEVDHQRRRLILSERQARREWDRARRTQLMDELEEGSIRRGVVSSFCDFGAFVSLGVMDGLIHISELSWDRVHNPADVLELGQEIDVYVLSVDKERERIALSLRRLQDDPWKNIASKYPDNSLIEGQVTNVLKFGAFVSLEPGIEGLIHISELDDLPVEDPHDVVVIGERLLLRVLHVDLERHRIALSLRQVTPEERESWYMRDIDEVPEPEMEDTPPEEPEP